jgi:2',3'-cyclic-nucleotide 2'-phosphodiesterase
MKVLFIGDVVGRPGRTCVEQMLPGLRDEFAIDFTIANGENAAGGLGATPKVLAELLEAGVDAVTLGNHTWRKKELVQGIEDFATVLRPANYPRGVPGKGAAAFPLADGRVIGVVNLLGRVFMEPVECPFTVGEEEVEALRRETCIVIVDMHAEATAEKIALGWRLDGRCSAVVGTHTHVQTADERILPQGTAYITDIGMAGPRDSVIGVEREAVINRFLTAMPAEFRVAKGVAMLNAVVIDVDDQTGRARSIERVIRFEA